MPHTTRRRAAALAVFAAMAAAFLAWAAPASADEADGGRLDWGVKESFRNYIVGPIAQGEATTGDGASVVGGVYRFHSATGEYDPDSGTASIAYTGWVHFWGHDGELDVTFANPSIEYSGSSGTLYVYVNGTRTDMATLSGPSIGGQTGTVAVEGASATLTAGGAAAFAGFYEAGEALDPVGFTADVTAPAPDPEPSEEASESADEEPAEDAGVSGAILDWGVRASWRDYVSGDIAAGSWQADGGAQDGGAVFRFTDGTGEADGGDYTLAFTGSVAFTGESVDLTITDPAVTAANGSGVLSAEVDGERIDLAEFEAELDERDGLLIAEDVPTVLSDDAVAAFSGYYQGGDEMDPLTIAVPLTPDAALPALPDLGSDPETESPSATGTFDTDTGELDAAFSGTVRFTGHHGELDLSITDLAVRGTGGDLSLYVGDTELADLDDVELGVVDGGLSVAGAAAVLTEAGAEFFTADVNGQEARFYEAGDEVDPVSFALAFDEDADLDDLPANPGGNGDDGAGPGGPKLPTTGSGLTWVLAAAAALIVAGVGALIMTRRRALAS